MGMNQIEGAGSIALSPLERDAIGEVMNISMGAAATAISQMLDKQVEITTPTVNIQPLETIRYEKLEPALMVKIVYTNGISGSNVMVFRQHDMQLILNTLMGIPDPPSDDFVFDDLSISAACEVMNQMMGSSATALAEFLNKKIDISTPTAVVMDEENTFIGTMGLAPETEMVTVTFRLIIKNMLDSEFMSVMTTDLVKEIVSQFISQDGDVHPLPEDVPDYQPPAQPQQQDTAPASQPQQQNAAPASQPQAYQQPAASQVANASNYQAAMPPLTPQGYSQYMPQPQSGTVAQQYQPAAQTSMPPLNVQPVEFPEFGSAGYGEGAPVMGSNLDLIMNVPLEVSIEIGTTKRKIKDILNFSSGTVVELDKQAGAPVDVVVNGQLIAHGDVVVIDDNFGVRITEIVGTKDLISSLGGQQEE